jgi:transposase
MKILGCDLHAKQQTIAMVDTETGEFTEKTLSHEGNEVREFYAALEGRVAVGIEATGAMHWFLELLEELGILCRVGHPAKIRAAETRKQKHDRRDARLMLDIIRKRVKKTGRQSDRSQVLEHQPSTTFSLGSLVSEIGSDHILHGHAHSLIYGRFSSSRPHVQGWFTQVGRRLAY